MRLVNVTTRYVSTSLSGRLAPGAVSFDGGKERTALEEVLSKIVKACGSSLGVMFNDREAALLSKLMDLEERGMSFDPSKIPEEIRKDPTGINRAKSAAIAAQKREVEDGIRKNRGSVEREALINGETLERKPVGPATMEGEHVDVSSLKSGFDKIFEENARIAAENSGKAKDSIELLDPIGAHMKKDAGDSCEVNAQTSGSSGTERENEINSVPRTQNPTNRMDAQAVEMERQLSTLGPVDDSGKPKSAENPKTAAKSKTAARSSSKASVRSSKNANGSSASKSKQKSE